MNLTTAQDTYATQNGYRKHEYGFLSGLNPLNQLDGGLQGYSIGTRKTTQTQQDTQVLHTGSTLHASQDVNLAGQRVTLDATHNTTTHKQQHAFSQTGITAGLSSPVLAAAQTANQMRHDLQQSRNSTGNDTRLTALAAATTGLAGKNAYDAITSNPAQAGGTGLNLSLGTSHSHSNTSESLILHWKAPTPQQFE
ncbi:hypothetical protein QS306_08150 [Paraburkholderia bonniea]|uniref:hypothetical protein n=1 Tax=Paraburkholderia bonniea TaxID=2152891 RepID=UPI002572E2FE|nr:hypothetical protein [Paraburkholderia bonniea]WJF89113.1 hypothetical protein QS306_08150 [Paraburkholderia bonniea]WJF92429.1 hypothetical protein QS308_08160 [Paraburkholderia bonniea]